MLDLEKKNLGTDQMDQPVRCSGQKRPDRDGTLSVCQPKQMKNGVKTGPFGSAPEGVEYETKKMDGVD